MRFNKEDIEVLDFIVDKSLTNSFSVTANDLIESGYIKKTNEKGYGSLTPEFDVSKEFTRYLGILKHHGVCKCVFTADGEFASSNDTTLNFQKQGGFKKMYANFKKEDKRDKLEFEKSKVDLELAKETLKEFPRTKWFARIGFIIAVLLLLKELYMLLKE